MLTDAFGWRAVFAINIPLVLINLTTALSGATLTTAMTGIAVIIAIGLLVALRIPGKTRDPEGQAGTEALAHSER